MRKRIKEAILETVNDLHNVGLVDKITLKNIEKLCIDEPKEYNSMDIKKLRERYRLSQTAIAKILNISPSTIRQWERGVKKPSGPARKLLEILDKKGIEVLMN